MTSTFPLLRLLAHQFPEMMQRPAVESVRSKRDRAMLAVLLGCGPRRAELVGLRLEDLQIREEHWIIADLIGKGKYVSTVPVPNWVKTAIDDWVTASGTEKGVIFRLVNRTGGAWGEGITPKAVWHVVKAAAKRSAIKGLAPHDLRRTCARLFHVAGGELDQIQFLLGHASVQTTERYLGCKQKLRPAVNDNTGIEISRRRDPPSPNGTWGSANFRIARDPVGGN